MAIIRANPHLSPIIESLDLHLQKYQGDTDKARFYLSKEDSEWIDGEMLHCITDSRYYISNYYAYRDEKEGFKGLYPLFDSQEILHEEYQKLKVQYGRVRALVLKARQMGSTTYNVARFSHETVFFEHINGIMVGKDQTQAESMFGMYDSALDFLPWWMKPRIAIRQTGTKINFDEKDEYLRATRPGNKTWIYCENANKPSGVGRGQTFNKALLSELSFWQNGSQLSKSLFPTFNSPDGFYVMESTANGRNDFWHNLWRRAEAGKVDWHPVFIPFYRRAKTYSIPIFKGENFTLLLEEKEVRDRVQKKEGFVIKDETFKWMRNKKEEFVATDGEDMMFFQEYTSEPEEAFQSSAITAFPRGIINKLRKRTRNPRWVGEISYDFDKEKVKTRVKEVDPLEDLVYPESENRLSIWEMPEAGARYCVGADVSLGNDGGDYSSISVVKLSDGLQDKLVAQWHGYIDPESLAEPVLALCWMYNEALAAVEVNSMGLITNNKLIRDYEYENIYRYKHLDKLKNWMTDLIGFYTNEKMKRAIMSKMSKALLDDAIEIPDKFIIDEFYDFTEYGAEGTGAHDDYIMSLMIALYCGHEGEYREIREGIKPKNTDTTGMNEFTILDRFGSVKLRTTSQKEAEVTAKKHIGAQIIRTPGATAIVNIAGQKRKVPSDYYNTDWSPIHDGDGAAHHLVYEEGYQPEEVTPELIAQYESEQQEESEDPNAWMYT